MERHCCAITVQFNNALGVILCRRAQGASCASSRVITHSRTVQLDACSYGTGAAIGTGATLEQAPTKCASVLYRCVVLFVQSGTDFCRVAVWQCICYYVFAHKSTGSDLAITDC